MNLKENDKEKGQNKLTKKKKHNHYNGLNKMMMPYIDIDDDDNDVCAGYHIH